jgi:soluble lytic murein transglycosylase-like protein
MLKRVGLILLPLILPVLVRAQQPQRPFSPPERPPVPLTDKDQERARARELAKQRAEGKNLPTATMPGRHISSGNASIDAIVYEAAAKYRLDPCLILSVMSAESGYNRLAVSPKGAMGLMQLMPATALRFGVQRIFDPRENIFGGASYLRWLLDRFGDVRLALAGYNAGEGAVEFYGNRIPPFLETQNYVRAIYSRYSRIHAGPAAAHDTYSEPNLSKPEPASIDKKEKIPTYNMIIRATSYDGEGKRQHLNR